MAGQAGRNFETNFPLRLPRNMSPPLDAFYVRYISQLAFFSVCVWIQGTKFLHIKNEPKVLQKVNKIALLTDIKMRYCQQHIYIFKNLFTISK